MNPDLLAALYSVGSAVVAAGVTWWRMRQGGGVKPADPTRPPPPTPAPPVLPSTGRPGQDLLLRLWAEWLARREREREESETRAFLAELGDRPKP